MNYDNLISEYEGIGIPYRGLCDDVKRIVMAIISNLHENNPNVNKVLCDSLSIYKFIKSISIEDNSCSIDFYDGDKLRNIKFGCYYFGDEYKKMCYTTEELMENGVHVNKIKRLAGTYKFKGDCHRASLYYLETFNKKNIKAITSICDSCQSLSFFHSYIWDCDSNLIYDLARNLVMDKDDFDYLFTLFEINCLSYPEFLFYNSSFPTKKYHELFNLSLVTLNNNFKKNNKHKIKIGV